MRSLAVDLGGTFLRLGVASDDAVSGIERHRIANFLDGTPADAVWEAIVSSIDAYARAAPLLGPDDPIVFAFPGPIVDGRIIAAPTVTGVDARVPDIAAELAYRTKRRVVMLNDVSAAAWYLSGKLRADRFMVLTVSSGIGSKVFDRRHPLGVIDDVGHAGELGHCTIDYGPDAPLCDCGGRGHLGAIASGRGAERLARRMAADEPDRFKSSRCALDFGATADTLDNELHLVQAMRDGDEWALEVLRRTIEPLARAVASVMYGIGLEQVAVIGGFALGVGPAYARMLASHLAPATDAVRFAPPRDDLVVLADMHPDACLLGAASFARRLVTAAP